MRPEKLFALFTDANRLKGVGPDTKKALARLVHGNEAQPPLLRDLVFHLPVGVIDRRNSPPLATAKDGDIVTLVVTVQSHQPPPRVRGRKLPYKVVCHTKQGFLTLVFFHARPQYVEDMLPVGEQRVVSGKIERYGEAPQITHPDIIAKVEELKSIQALEPVYPLTGGLTNRRLAKTISQALEKLPDLAEWIDAEFLKRQKWASWKASLLAAHKPQTPEDLSRESPSRARLAYDEMLANQLALAVLRQRLHKREARPLKGDGQLRAKVRAALPFTLTQGQDNVLREIDADLASGERMLRLLQGDVGSGKTAVALMAMLAAVEEGRQAAIMAPTELLGRQHFAFFSRVAAPLGVRVMLLTGGMKPKEHADALAAIASGDADIVIGTHALFQEKVAFKDLAVAVIDEQHRFGVSQRMTLTNKSKDTHVLVMTATPIPRTLTMTAFGDMDVSVLAEKPAGRQAIDTRAVPMSRREEVLDGIARATKRGEKAYWICPLVEESTDENTKSDLAAVVARFTEFTARFGKSVGLAHGRMPPPERDRIMTEFAAGALNVLVATTVVEVGVDVPDATIIVIEHAERFGLAQLHQLRGRVGRSDKKSACVLLYSDRPGEVAKARLGIIRETNDGFRIAEEDLRLRGSGDILGTRQSGFPEFRFADLLTQQELLRTARDDAKLALSRDPQFTSPRGQALRHLLYLFGYDESIRLTEAG